MIDLSHIQYDRFFLLGYGVSNQAAAKALIKAGKHISVWDDDPEKQALARKNGCLVSDNLEAHEVMIVSPGVVFVGDKAHPLIKKARDQNMPITNDVGLFRMAKPEAKIIGITGTNGKSTTTALIGHILKTAGKNVAVGGNLGKAVLVLDDEAALYVLELSSYQLESADYIAPDVAILLNITPDHLDHHGTMDAYRAAKHKLLKDASFVIKGDDQPFEDVIYQGAGLSQFTKLQGVHNRQNIICAYQACKHVGLNDDQIWQGVADFKGLPHRQYEARKINHVRYINDSKATNVEALITALKTFDAIYLIAGGRAKGDDLSPIAAYKNKIQKVYLIGEAAQDFSKWFGAHDIDNILCDTMDKAVEKAHMDAQNNEGEAVVLLAPACASFDQYPNFPTRGDHFEALVDAL